VAARSNTCEEEEEEEADDEEEKLAFSTSTALVGLPPTVCESVSTTGNVNFSKIMNKHFTTMKADYRTKTKIRD
jgi:hypothetical protein